MMPVIAQGLVGLVILIQVVITIGEIFLWEKLYKRLETKIVFPTLREAQNVTPIVQNAGLYNLFLAAGLIWGLIAQTNALVIQSFFLACVLVAGIFGFITLERRTVLILQAVPALAALIAVWYVNSLV